jgi:hypothetical protein
MGRMTDYRTFHTALLDGRRESRVLTLILRTMSPLFHVANS